MADVSIDRRSSAPVKFDDRPGRVSERGRAAGISEFRPSESHEKFTEQVRKNPSGSVAYYVERDMAQKMANSQKFFVRQTTLSKARDNNYWIVGIDTGSDATSSRHVHVLKEAAEKATAVPEMYWPHNAVRFGDL